MHRAGRASEDVITGLDPVIHSFVKGWMRGSSQRTTVQPGLQTSLTVAAERT
jgi:hypothetical protein